MKKQAIDFIKNKGEAHEYSHNLEVVPLVDVLQYMQEFAAQPRWQRVGEVLPILRARKKNSPCLIVTSNYSKPSKWNFFATPATFNAETEIFSGVGADRDRIFYFVPLVQLVDPIPFDELEDLYEK